MKNPSAFRAGVEDTVRRRGLLKGGEHVVVAVSGGQDSLALLAVLRDLAPSWDLRLHVAHFDHRLREGSSRDAAFVARVARRLDLAVTTGAAPPAAPPAGLSPEESARERRLRFLEDVASTHGADRIATGHTLDDQAETVLMRLASGAGARGLGGIPPERGAFIRPLIERRRAETLAYCRAAGLRPRPDPTNDDPAVPRNAVRLRILPLIAAALNPRTTENIARVADLLREDDRFLDEAAASAIDAEPVSGGTRLGLERLLALPLALRRRAVRLALPGDPPDARQVERILGLAAGGRSGDAIDLPEGLNARLEYGSLVLGRAPSSDPPPSPVVPAVPGSTALPGWNAVVTAWIEETPPAAWPDGRTVCVVDLDRLSGTIAVRARRRGDRYRPLGMSGSRTLADVLGEAKVPRAARDRVPLVVAGDEIVWVAGHGIAEPARVTDATRRFLWMRFEDRDREGGSPWGN